MTDPLGPQGCQASSLKPLDCSSGTKRQIPEQVDRRVKLRVESFVPNVLLDLCQKTSLPDLQPRDLWNQTKSDDSMEYHAKTGYEYKAYIMKQAIAELRKSYIKAIIKEKIWMQAIDDAMSLESALNVLNNCNGNQDPTSDRDLQMIQNSEPAADELQPTMEEIESAKKELHAWLNKPATPLRAMLTILSGGGFFFVAHTAEKTMRDWVASGTTND